MKFRCAEKFWLFCLQCTKNFTITYYTILFFSSRYMLLSPILNFSLWVSVFAGYKCLNSNLHPLNMVASSKNQVQILHNLCLILFINLRYKQPWTLQGIKDPYTLKLVLFLLLDLSYLSIKIHSPFTYTHLACAKINGYKITQ